MTESEHTSMHIQTEGNTNIKSHSRTSEHLIEEMNQRLKTLESQIQKLCLDNTNKTEREDNKSNDGFRERVRKKATKSLSFNGRVTYSRRRPYRHTVPSEKEESKRIEEFQKQCMSKAIKCNTVDIVKSYIRKDKPILFQLPQWLSSKDRLEIQSKPGIKFQARKFLMILREQDFHTAREWIEKGSNLEEAVRSNIWKTFQEFNDIEHIMKRLCIYCKLKMKVNCADIIDHFCSIELISDDLYNEINSSSGEVGSQDIFWGKISEQCAKFPIQSYVQEALKIALEDSLGIREETDYKNVIIGILKELSEECNQKGNLFRCNCKTICSKELQPLSLMASRSLSTIYKLPQNKRKSKFFRKENDSGDDGLMPGDTSSSSSSVSSNESNASDLKMKKLCSFENEVYQRNSNLVTLDGQHFTVENSSRCQTWKQTNRNPAEKIVTDKNLTRKKIPYVVNDDTDISGKHDSNQIDDTGRKIICQRATKKANLSVFKNDTNADNKHEPETSSSSESVTLYRSQSLKLLGKRKKISGKAPQSLSMQVK